MNLINILIQNMLLGLTLVHFFRSQTVGLKNIIFGVYNISSGHTDNKKNIFW